MCFSLRRYVEVTPEWLARFWQRLCELRPQTQLILAGHSVFPGLDRPFRSALAAVPSPPDVHITWLGYVPGPALPAIYARTGCAIFPAQAVPLQQAKCSVRLATTLLQGVPVVASAVGEQRAYGADGAARLVAAHATPETLRRSCRRSTGTSAGSTITGKRGHAPPQQTL